MLKTVLIVHVLFTLAYGLQYDGLRAKFGWSNALEDVEYFFKIPRTIKEAEADGWRRTERPPGPLPELRMYCPPGRNVCPLYDTAGFVSGLQVGFPVEEFVSPVVKPEKLFVKWHAPAADGEPAKDFYTSTQFYVSEESLKAGAGPTIENGATLQDGGVWVKGPDGHLMRIPTTEAELNSTKYKKQNCIPNMGTHYYYNMTRQMACEDFFPWFALVTQGDLIGTGFQVIGKLNNKSQKHRNWFEDFSNPEKSIQTSMPLAPDCMADWMSKYGLISLHIYFTKTPWEIKCSANTS